MVVLWHWVFTIVIWRDDGPHATNPIGFFDGLFLATWLLQVMPLFFFVGGYSHLRAWESAQRTGVGIWTFVGRRIRTLTVPALAVVAVWAALGVVVTVSLDAGWMARAVRLVVSPLWFLVVYLLLIALLPIALWLHRRFGVLVLVWGAGLAAVVDIVRFRNDLPWVGWLNMVVVWGLCHQLGFFYDGLVAGGRRVAWALTWGGLFGLAALVYTGFYPGSMVGVPGDRFSNMAPPTLPIVALNRYAMPLYLFHMTGLAVARGSWHWIRGGQERREPDLVWWLARPFAFLGAALVTVPIIWLFGRRWATPSPARSESPLP